MLRARFFRFEVRLFGTAIVVEVVRESIIEKERLPRFTAAPSLLLRLLRWRVGGLRRRYGSQRVPSRVDGNARGTLARAEIEIYTAGGTQPFAVLPAVKKSRYREKPLFTDNGPEIDFVDTWIQWIDVRVVGLFVIRIKMAVIRPRPCVRLQAPAEGTVHRRRSDRASKPGPTAESP